MSIFEMSLTASILIAAIVIMRTLCGNKLPKKTFLVLWGIVLVRLLIPFTAPPLPGLHPIEIPHGLTRVMDVVAVNPYVSILPVENGPLVTAIPINGGISTIAAIWVVGVIVFALFFVISHFRCRKEYMAALPVENDYVKKWLNENKLRRTIYVRQSDRINIPITYGILKPFILFPKSTDWQDETLIYCILTHEQTHIRRFDIIVKWLIAAALCVHWFSPLVWAMYVLINRDIELACDESTLNTLGHKAKRNYAMALIGLEQCKNGLLPMANYFNKNPIEERIISIMKAKRFSISAIIVAVVLVIVTAGAVYALSATNDVQAYETLSNQCLEPAGMTTGVHEPDTRYYPSFYYHGEFIDVMASYAYAMAVYEASGTRPFYTREQLIEIHDARYWLSGYTDVRQPHIQPIPGYVWAGESGHNVCGAIAPASLCDNTHYTVILGERICTSCGYMFTKEQNIEIGWGR